MISSVNVDNYHPNFGAKFINSKDALRLSFNRNYVPHLTHIIELTQENTADYNALEALYEPWRNAKYINPIISKYHPKERKIFALTSQQENLSNPNPEKILGLADMYLQEDSAYLKFLQADPRILESTNRNYKHIGQALLYGITEYLKKQNFSCLKINSTRDNRPLYKKLFPNIVEKSANEIYFYNMVLDLKNKGIQQPTYSLYPSANIEYFG